MAAAAGAAADEVAEAPLVTGNQAPPAAATVLAGALKTTPARIG